MIQVQSVLHVADNTGAKKLRVIKVLRGYKRRYGHVGDVATCSVIEAAPRGMVKKGELVQAVVVRTKKETRRPNGTYVRFGDNAAVVVEKGTKEPKGTAIFGPVARELRTRGFQKVISLAPEVL